MRRIVAERNHIFPFDLSDCMISILHNGNYSVEKKNTIELDLAGKGITNILWRDTNDILISRCIATLLYFSSVKRFNEEEIEWNFETRIS